MEERGGGGRSRKVETMKGGRVGKCRKVVAV